MGGATVIGSLLGFLLKDISQKFSHLALAFSAGVMLAAAVVGSILPSVDRSHPLSLILTVAGVFSGAICLDLADRLAPRLHALSPAAGLPPSAELDRTLLFVTAVAIHNLPEGIAAGVGFGSGNTAQALMIAGGIALHNLPEGMVVIAPMLAVGFSPRRTFLCAMATGMVEALGTLAGYLASRVFSSALPFTLSFAGGTMLYVICREMIPASQSSDSASSPAYALLAGFCVMLIADILLT